MAHSLYIIIEGEVEVVVAVEARCASWHTWASATFIGEMGMMTGEPRTSTVIALTDVKCYRLGPDCLRDILQRRPEVAEQISLTLARRRLELDGAREELSAAASRERLRLTQHTFLGRLRDVFSLPGGEQKR